MTRNLIETVLVSIVILCLLTKTTSEPLFRKSCGPDLFERVAKLCSKRGYNRMDYYRGKRGIVMECCLNACSDNELNLYCSGDPDVSENDVEFVHESNEQ